MRCVTFGQRLRRVIEAHDTTPVEVAKRMGVSIQIVTNYLGESNDNPQLLTLFKLAKAIPSTVEELCEGLDDEYDAKRRQDRAPARLAELWQRVDPEPRRQLWRLLLSLAGVPVQRDDAEPPSDAGGPQSTPDPHAEPGRTIPRIGTQATQP